MLKIDITKKFKKDLEKIKKQDKDISKLKNILSILQSNNVLPIKNKDHQLKGRLKEFRECHIEPDWLLMYKIENDILMLVRTGSHSDLFE